MRRPGSPGPPALSLHGGSACAPASWTGPGRWAVARPVGPSAAPERHAPCSREACPDEARPRMKRIGILTAGGDTPALNATIHGAVVRANQRRVEVYGFIKGFSGLMFPEVPHVHLNPLFMEIPELDATRGGTILGASRAYVNPSDTATVDAIAD